MNVSFVFTQQFAPFLLINILANINLNFIKTKFRVVLILYQSLKLFHQPHPTPRHFSSNEEEKKATELYFSFPSDLHQNLELMKTVDHFEVIHA